MVAGSCSLAGRVLGNKITQILHFKFIYYLKTGQCNTNNLDLSQRSYCSSIIAIEKVIKKFKLKFKLFCRQFKHFVVSANNSVLDFT